MSDLEMLAEQTAETIREKAVTDHGWDGQLYAENAAADIIHTALTKAHAAGAAEERARVVALLQAEILNQQGGSASAPSEKSRFAHRHAFNALHNLLNGVRE